MSECSDISLYWLRVTTSKAKNDVVNPNRFALLLKRIDHLCAATRFQYLHRIPPFYRTKLNIPRRREEINYHEVRGNNSSIVAN